MNNLEPFTQFSDHIHGIIQVSHCAKLIIDTPEFQRLRKIKQLGVVPLVFTNATHSRFEHSLGVYHNAGILLDNLKKKYPRLVFDNQYLGNNIKLSDPNIYESIKIGGLVHDLGHGPFSHIFDDIILRDSTHENKSHEVRSEILIERILKRLFKDKIETRQIQFIASIVNPKKGDVGWVYQIVCNYLNGIDVDKMDYISRDAITLYNVRNLQFDRLLLDICIDSNNNLCYPNKDGYFITELFRMRYSLHKLVYNHKTVKLIEYYIKIMCELMEPILMFKQSIMDMDKFILLTDETLFEMINNHHLITCSKKNRERILKAQKVYLNLLNRKLYKYVGDYISNNGVYLESSNFVDSVDTNRSNNSSNNNSDNDDDEPVHGHDEPVHVDKKIKLSVPLIDDNDFLIVTSKINYNSKPNLNNIFLYDSKASKREKPTSFEMQQNQISSMLSVCVSTEYISYLYCKNGNKFNILKEKLNQIKSN